MIPLRAGLFYYGIFFTSLAGFAIPGLRTSHLFDDAYMFWRYADHVVKGEGMVWNAEDGPVYGPTSLLFLGVVTLFRFIVHNPPLLLTLCSATGLLLAGIFMWRLRRKSVSDDETMQPWFTWFFVAGIAGVMQPMVLHGYTGMDTSLAVAYMGIYMLLWVAFERQPSSWLAIAIGVAGGLIWLVRPEMLMCTLIMPGVMLLGVPSRRRHVLVLSTVTVLSAGLVTLVLNLYTGSFVPMSFYIKGINYYDDAFTHFHRNWSLKYGFIFLARTFPLWATICAGMWLLRRNKISLRPLAWAALIAATVHCIYVGSFVTQVMGMGSRFYVPVLPLLMFAALANWEKLLVVIRESGKTRAMPWLLIAGFVWLGINFADSWYKVGKHIEEFRAYDNMHAESIFMHRYQRYWLKLDEFSKFPNDLKFATTEVGLISAMNPGKTIYDMSGLNDASLAVGKEALTDLILHKRPDVVYIPLQSYKGMNEEIWRSKRMIEEYIMYSDNQLSASQGLAILKSSPYYERLKEILEKEIRALSSRFAQPSH